MSFNFRPGKIHHYNFSKIITIPRKQVPINNCINSQHLHMALQGDYQICDFPWDHTSWRFLDTCGETVVRTDSIECILTAVRRNGPLTFLIRTAGQVKIILQSPPPSSSSSPPICLNLCRIVWQAKGRGLINFQSKHKKTANICQKRKTLPFPKQ